MMTGGEEKSDFAVERKKELMMMRETEAKHKIHSFKEQENQSAGTRLNAILLLI